ncbi:hypothetical protein EDB86DRAFT_2831378 [Lactarius hatsudake]|nr:hypothetical protein EDB86DRAFT_2831378 [Lactarius hatsudake]
MNAAPQSMPAFSRTHNPRSYDGDVACIAVPPEPTVLTFRVLLFSEAISHGARGGDCWRRVRNGRHRVGMGRTQGRADARNGLISSPKLSGCLDSDLVKGKGKAHAAILLAFADGITVCSALRSVECPEQRNSGVCSRIVAFQTEFYLVGGCTRPAELSLTRMQLRTRVSDSDGDRGDNAAQNRCASRRLITGITLSIAASLRPLGPFFCSPLDVIRPLGILSRDFFALSRSFRLLVWAIVTTTWLCYTWRTLVARKFYSNKSDCCVIKAIKSDKAIL